MFVQTIICVLHMQETFMTDFIAALHVINTSLKEHKLHFRHANELSGKQRLPADRLGGKIEVVSTPAVDQTPQLAEAA